MWMAQNFLNSSTTGERLDPESIGEQYFNHLAEGSFFQEFTRGGYHDETIVSCKMHDLVHDFAQFLSKKQNMHHEHEVDLSSFPNTLMFEVKHMRTLLVFPYNDHYSFINDHLSRPAVLFRHLRFVRVLQLEIMSIEQLPNEIKELIHLRYLDLSGNDSLFELPNSVCSLFNLQTLNLDGCRSLDKLPQGMEKMINLKHLILFDTARNLTLPEEIGKLTSLQTLGKVINIEGARGISQLRVLKDLNHLQGDLGITGLGNLKTINDASQAELHKKIGLVNLELNFNGGDNNNDDDDDDEGSEENKDAIMQGVFEAVQPHPNLKELWIGSYRGRTFPVGWFESLTSLSILRLHRCFNCTELPALGLLPSLKTLELTDLNNIKCIGVEIFGRQPFNLPRFPNLTYLSLNFMEGLEELVFGVGKEGGGGGEIAIMPRLIEFVINGCPKLKTLRGLQSLEVLQSLDISKCPNLKLSSSSLQQLHLPNLNKLRLEDCAFLSEKLPTSSPNLTSLVIVGASHALPPEGLAELKKLQDLCLWNCSFMTRIPEEVRHLVALQTLTIRDCDWPPQIIHPNCRIEEEYEEAWRIMFHIPNIKIGRKRDKYFLISTRTVPTGTRRHSYDVY